MYKDMTIDEVKKAIIEKLGKKQGRTVQLTKVNNYYQVYGLYHWRGEVRCLMGGYDYEFEGLDTDSQREEVYNHIMNDDFKINNTLQ